MFNVVDDSQVCRNARQPPGSKVGTESENRIIPEAKLSNESNPRRIPGKYNGGDYSEGGRRERRYNASWLEEAEQQLGRYRDPEPVSGADLQIRSRIHDTGLSCTYAQTRLNHFTCCVLLVRHCRAFSAV